LAEAGIEPLPGRFLDFRDPWGNRIEIVGYDNIQFTKAPNVLRGMRLSHLSKNEKAKKELADKGVGIDHIVLRVGDYEKSKAFYDRLLGYLGFEISDEYDDAIGWTNGKTRFWIGPADEEGLKHKHRTGNIGFHHYAFQLRSRKDVDALQKFLEETGATIVDPAGEYYDDYYAVFFLDPDGMKLEGMRWGERHEHAAKKRAAKKRSAAAKKRTPSARKKRG